jgi:phosphoribosylamine--glycine ligase
MNVAVIGSGGREHAIVWKLRQSPDVQDVFVLPGNGGTSTNLPVKTDDFAGVAAACHKHSIAWVIVGPETPLAAGIVPYLEAREIRAFGPDPDAARLESSKVWAKAFMQRHGVATAASEAFDDVESAMRHIERLGSSANMVIKEDGLASGKGVTVCEEGLPQARSVLAKIAEQRGRQTRILIEERLRGVELSLIGFTDGKTIRLLLPAQDHKQLLDGDRGPNTGGMGAFCPVPWCNGQTLAKIEHAVIEPTLVGLRAEKLEYRGVLYFGLMLTEDGPRLLEYNVRFGDPEAEVLIPALKTDLLTLVRSCREGTLSSIPPLEFHPETFVGVVLASEGYPGKIVVGRDIEGLDDVPEDALVFHAGTCRQGKRLVTSGGRVLHIVGRGADLRSAIDHAYSARNGIRFDGMVYRIDIGRRAWPT